MPDEIFPTEFVPNIEGAQYHPRWVKANPNEAAKWDTYRDAANAHRKGRPAPGAPAMATKYGKALVAAGKLHVSVTDLGSVYDPPVDPPPGGDFGGDLPARLAESTGATINVASVSALTSALSSAANGSTINITSSLTGPGDTLSITRDATAAAPITITCDDGIVLEDFTRIAISGANYIRLRGLEITGFTGDGIKIDSGSTNIEIDGCYIHDGYRQGILAGSSSASVSNIQIWNCIIHNCGNTANGSLDHGIYFGYTQGDCVIANNLFYENCAYQLQVYPDSPGVIITCNTIDDGISHANARGGMVIGSQTTATTGDTINVGLIVTNAPNSNGVRIQQPLLPNNLTADAIAFGNASADYETDANMTYTNCLSTSPLHVNSAARNYHLQSTSPAIDHIQSARYGYVPETDIDGATRVTADAGCYAA